MGLFYDQNIVCDLNSEVFCAFFGLIPKLMSLYLISGRFMAKRKKKPFWMVLSLVSLMTKWFSLKKIPI